MSIMTMVVSIQELGDGTLTAYITRRSPDSDEFETSSEHYSSAAVCFQELLTQLDGMCFSFLAGTSAGRDERFSEVVG